jgi:hypothetical protein
MVTRMESFFGMHRSRQFDSSNAGSASHTPSHSYLGSPSLVLLLDPLKAVCAPFSGLVSARPGQHALVQCTYMTGRSACMVGGQSFTVAKLHNPLAYCGRASRSALWVPPAKVLESALHTSSLRAGLCPTGCARWLTGGGGAIAPVSAHESASLAA